MIDEDLGEGDTVCLEKGDGTLMCVEQFSGSRRMCQCSWMEGDTVYRQWFYAACLLTVLHYVEK